MRNISAKCHRKSWHDVAYNRIIMSLLFVLVIFLFYQSIGSEAKHGIRQEKEKQNRLVSSESLYFSSASTAITETDEIRAFSRTLEHWLNLNSFKRNSFATTSVECVALVVAHFLFFFFTHVFIFIFPILFFSFLFRFFFFMCSFGWSVLVLIPWSVFSCMNIHGFANVERKREKQHDRA